MSPLYENLTESTQNDDIEDQPMVEGILKPTADGYLDPEQKQLRALLCKNHEKRAVKFAETNQYRVCFNGRETSDIEADHFFSGSTILNEPVYD